MTTKSLGVGLVPPAAGEDAGPRLAAPVVGNHLRSVLGSVQSAIKATPVPDQKDVHLVDAADLRGGPVLTLVAHGCLGGHAAHACVVRSTARPLFRVELVARETIQARGTAAALTCHVDLHINL